MAGTATVTLSLALTDLGHLPISTCQFQVTGVDEAAYQYAEIATESSIQITTGNIDTVTGLWLRVVTGGTTAATGVSVDLADGTQWTAGDFVLTQGQAIFVVPSYGAGEETYVKNLSATTTAVVEYLVFGDNT